ncbi:hypothetical protein BC332_30306 [Capsicum chinense]|nr:hypothetical protein BC332_30306 [Capsicum chinense]
MVYDLLKRRFMYENKDKMDEVWINYCDFAASSECSSSKYQDCKEKHDGVINSINALTASVKEMTSKKGVIPSKRISYPETPLEIKAAKRGRKDNSKASSIIKKKARLQRLCLCLVPMWTICCISLLSIDNSSFLGGCHIEATAEEHNITVDNPSTASKEEEKVEPFNLGEWKNYPFEGFNISDEALKKLTQLINDYSEWIANRLLKHHAGSISTGLPWYLVDEVYIPIHWVLAVIVLKERHIRVYDSMLQRRYFGSSSEIQKLIKILPTYLDMSGFLNQKVCTDWSTIEAYRDKMANPFDVQYVEGISQQTIGSLDCGPFVTVYVEYLSDGLQVPNDGLDAGLLQKRYAALLGKYGEVKAQKPYATDVKDPR